MHGASVTSTNLEFCHTTSSPSRSLSSYCLCCSCYRFSVSEYFWHCLPHTDFTTQPPYCFMWHHCPLPSLLQFAVWKHSWHSLTHVNLTTPPPSHFIRHHCPLPSLLHFAIWKHSWHCVTHMLLRESAALVVPLFSCHLSDHHHASHGSSVLGHILHWTAQALGTFLLCSSVCSSQLLTVTLSRVLA